MYGLISSYSCLGTACLYDLILKSFEKLYLRPNSVYCAEVTRSCKTSRCASMGLFFHPSMRQSLIRASEDMAGLSNFINTQNKKFVKLLIKILLPGHQWKKLLQRY